jgi:hypothetical protein
MVLSDSKKAVKFTPHWTVEADQSQKKAATKP